MVHMKANPSGQVRGNLSQVLQLVVSYQLL